MWKNLGMRRGWPVRIVKFYAQKSSSDARKMLVTWADSATIAHGSRERRPLASGVGNPSGGGSSATGVRGRARSPPRRALRAIQPAPHRDGCVEAGVPTPPLRPLGHVGRLPRRRTSPDPRRVLRSAADGWWRCDARGSRPAAPFIGPAPVKSGVPPECRSRMGKPVLSRSRGGRQRLLERRQRRLQERF